MWGCFIIALACIIGWWVRRQRKATYNPKDSGCGSNEQQQASQQGSGNGAANGSVSSTKPHESWFTNMWSKKWFRRAVFLARLGYLAADVALDIRVAVWLYNDGARAEAIVCTLFLALSQFVVAVGVFVGLLSRTFNSVCSALVLSPLLLAVTPVVAPVLALWNMVNPDIPLVFWR